MKIATIVLLLLAAAALPARAADVAKSWRAVIVAPAEIQLAKTFAVPFTVVLQRLNRDQPAPAKLRIWTTEGTLVQEIAEKYTVTSAKPGEPLVIDTPALMQRLAVLLPGVTTTRPTMRLDVTTADEANELLGTVDIKVRWPGRMEFAQVSKTIAADGKATGKIRLRITDRAGAAIDDMPLILRSGTNDLVLAAVTDKNGYAEFIIPAAKTVGSLLAQITSSPGSIVTPQFEFHYVTKGAPDRPWLIPDPNWWKKPLEW